jgi:hypothetical protein
MTSVSEAQVCELLRAAKQSTLDSAPRRDLWPEVRTRLSRPAAPPRPVDWLLLAGLALWCLLQPGALRMVLVYI